MVPEPPWFRWLGAAKVCKPATPSPALARSYHDGITRQSATFTPTVALRPIKGAAVLMKKEYA